MAGARCATFSFLSPPSTANSITRRVRRRLKPAAAAAAKRQNYLRIKILKTLNKPYPPSTTLPLEPPSSETPSLLDFPVEIPSSDEPAGPNGEHAQVEEFQEVENETPSAEPGLTGGEYVQSEVEEFQVSEAVSTVTEYGGGGVGLLSAKWVLSLGLCLVGAFVIQSFQAGWLLGKAVSETEQEQENGGLGNSGLVIQEQEQENGSLGNSGLVDQDDAYIAEESFLNGIGHSFVGSLGNQGEEIVNKGGNYVHLVDSELKEKIEEIRKMARKVRRMEGRKSGGDIGEADSESDDDEEEVKKDKGEIEKEIDRELGRVRRNLGSVGRKSLGSSVGRKYVKLEDGKNKDGVGLEELNSKLMFKKKYKLKSPSIEPGSKPNGIEGLKSVDTSKEKSTTGSVGDDGMGLLDQEKQVNLHDGDSPQSIPRSSDVNDGKNLKKKSRSNSGRGMGFATTESRTGQRGTSKRRGGRKEAVVSEGRDKLSDMKTDLWWLNLPYVLAISMRRGSGTKGLFSVKIPSQTQKQSVSSYTVAFENHGDANNFCHLLDSFFEGLDDFSAGIVPMPTKELHEEVKSDEMKVIVVKKGELKLYVGQPLTDVELALRSLVQQN